VYALKKVSLENLSQKERENALNEIRILASITHENIIGYKESFLDGKCLCIVMDFASDGDLYQKIVKNKKEKSYFVEDFVWKVLIGTLQALAQFHDMKIFHRDIKSANIFLNKNGTAVLGDLNVSKVAKQGLLYTQTGTPYYASPEVWKDLPYDTKSDIWSLGCVFYEVLTLHPPFRAKDMNGLFKKVTLGVFDDPPKHFSADLRNLVTSMIRVNPKDRPSSD
jgi:NIMA (never in mitosis gene a)-related kinase 1/4/5